MCFSSQGIQAHLSLQSVQHDEENEQGIAHYLTHQAPGSDLLNPALYYGNPSYAFAVAGHSNSCDYDSTEGGTLGVKPPPC